MIYLKKVICITFLRSLEEDFKVVQNLQSQVDMLHNRVEEAQQQVREEMKEEMQRQIAELLKQFGNQGNSPS
ncbi:hypothetical protein Hanom_Chr10g00894741 [Helianthus anomalus]